MPYDILVLGAYCGQSAGCELILPTNNFCCAAAGVGSVNNTFGIQGVEQHTSFFKTVEDAKAGTSAANSVLPAERA